MTIAEPCDRAERFLPSLESRVLLDGEVTLEGMLSNISRTGLACTLAGSDPLKSGQRLRDVSIVAGATRVCVSGASVVRSASAASGTEHTVVGIRFDDEHPELIQALSDSLRPYAYVTGELSQARNAWPRATGQPPGNDSAADQTLDQFYRQDGPDLFAKCARFRAWSGAMEGEQIYQRLYRVTATGGLDNQITVFDPVQRRERVLRCFDSNSYLGIHRHPRVVEKVRHVTSLVGYGTPSAQVLCGTNRYLRELEAKLSEIHGREDTIVFPTGYAANTGTLAALLRDGDAVVADQRAHASLQEGCRASSAGFRRRFAHNDPADLDRVLSELDASPAEGKLVATDGVFSMHGAVAPLPEILDVCARHGARSMVDDAHGFGVLGDDGWGVESHFSMRGRVDVLMGTLSKAVGCLGGYVSGDRDLITYLRWFAGSGLFTTALPAAACAGMHEALCVMEQEPEHREAMWRNTRYFAGELRTLGFSTPAPESPIVTVYVGPQARLFNVTRALFDAGVKCAGVIYPAVPADGTVLRFAVNARHTRQDLDYTLDALLTTGRQHGLLDLTGSRLAHESM